MRGAIDPEAIYELVSTEKKIAHVYVCQWLKRSVRPFGENGTGMCYHDS